MQEWNPARTWIFAVGVLEFASKDFARFKQKGRRDADLVEALHQKGVPREHILYLQDSQATLSNIQSSMQKHLGRAQSGDQLIFYYCGHGFHHDDDPSQHFFANYDAGDDVSSWWSMPSVVDAVEQWFAGSHAILAADCCLSGALAEAVKQRTHLRVPLAVLSSSMAKEISTGNWTFTQAVLDGFTGHPAVDTEADGMVDLAELARHSYEDMLLFEDQLSVFTTSPGFDAQFVLARGETRPPAPYGDRVEVLYEDGAWYRARVLESNAHQRKVRWIQIGWDTADNDTWVQQTDTRPIQPVQFAVGSRVSVDSDGESYPATVLQVDHSVHLIHYDDYDSSWDEWVTAAQLTSAN
jgi:hypothetical protein